MPATTTCLDRPSAVALLRARGFNRLDIECVLDLTEHNSEAGTPVWQMDRLQRVAGRAYWLTKQEIACNAA